MEGSGKSSSARPSAASSGGSVEGDDVRKAGAGRPAEGSERGRAGGGSGGGPAATKTTRQSEDTVAAVPPSSSAPTEDEDEDIITLGPGWMNKSGTRSLGGSREVPLAFIGKGTSSSSVPTSSSKVVPLCYTKEEVLALHNVGDECPSDFLALPYIYSEETLAPVNLSPDLLKDFEELQRKYLYNICPSRGSSAARGGAAGRGRGRGRGRGTEPLGRRDREGGSSRDGSGSGVYRPPRGRGRSSGYSWEGDERRPAWADTPIDKDQPKGRFRGGRFRGDSDSEGSADEAEHEDVFSDSEDVESEEDEAPGTGWMYKDPQNIVRGPFSNREMHEWYLGGFFPRNLPVKRESEEDFKPLSSYEGNPFAPQRKKKPMTKKEKSKDLVESEGKSRGDWGDWRRRSDKGAPEKERDKPSSKREDESKERAKDDKGSWRSDIPREGKKEAEASTPPTAAKDTKKDELTPVEKKVEEMRKAAQEAKQAKPEKKDKEELAAPSAPSAQPTAAKDKLAGTEGKRDSIDVSDTESLDDILDHFPHLNTDFVVSSDDEGEERTPAFLGAGRPQPTNAAPPITAWGSKPAWNAQELEMRQFQQFNPAAPVPAGDKIAMGSKPPQLPSAHIHPHAPFPGAHEGKSPYMQPPHPMMGPGQPPQFFPGMQPGFRPGAAPGGPAGPHPIPGLERRQGVFDMAAIEEQLMKQSHMPGVDMHQRMPAMHQPPHMPPHAPPQHAAPWMMAMHGKPGGAPLSLREIQEQELRERQQRHHQMPPPHPQAFPHHMTPEQMLHHHQMMSEQHKQMHLMRQQLGMPGMRAPGQPDPIFQSVWGLPPDAPIPIQELQARLQKEREAEERANAESADGGSNVEQELHDHEGQEEAQKEATTAGNETDGQEPTANGDSQTSKEAGPANDEDIWGVPQQQQEAVKQPAKSQPQRAEAEKTKAGKKQKQKKNKGAQTSSPQQQKQKGAAKKQTETKPPSLKEIQEQELLERQKQQKQQKQTATPSSQGSGESKNLQHFLSAWGFAPSSDSTSWGSSDDAPSLKEIQEQEAVQRELAQMEEQQKRRQQLAQQASPTNAPAWSGAAGKKLTLSEIQAEELKEQQKRQKEMQKMHKEQLKAQREQQARWNSPWAASQGSGENATLSLREIQELEQRKALEEASKRKKNTPGTGGAEPITKLLWETRVGANEPAVPLSEIMAQEEAASHQSEETKPKKEPAVSQEAEGASWSAPQAQGKASLRDIQQEEQQKSKQQPQQPTSSKKKKGQQPPSPAQPEKAGNKKQSQTPQKGANQKKQQPQQQQSKGGVWGAVSQTPKISLLDIQEKQQLQKPAPSPAAPATPAPTKPAPSAAPAPAVEDDFWGTPSETPTTTGSGKSGRKADAAAAPAIIDDSHFPALGGSSNNAKKPAGQQQKAAGATGQAGTWQKPASGGGAANTAGGRGGARLSSSSGSNATAQPAQAPKAPKSGGAKGGAASTGGKKKMQKVDPSLLGFSSNVQDRIAQGQVLPIDP